MDRAQPPANWDCDNSDRFDQPPTLGPDRKLDWPTGLSVRGLTGQWALIPIGHSTVELALEHGRIDASRIDRLELRPSRGAARVVFDRQRALGSLSRVALSEPGRFEWIIRAHEPNDRAIEARITIWCGAELRLLRHTIDSAAPVIELEVGGSLDPQVLGATVGGRNGCALEVESWSWESVGRILRMRLQPFSTVGSLADVHPRLEWPNRFIQHGPGLERLTLEPNVFIESPPARVGSQCVLHIRSNPMPVSVRIAERRKVLLTTADLRFTPIVRASHPWSSSIARRRMKPSGARST